MTPVLDIVRGGHFNVAMTQLFAGGEQSVTGMGLAAEFFLIVCNGVFETTSWLRSQASSARISFM